MRLTFKFLFLVSGWFLGSAALQAEPTVAPVVAGIKPAAPTPLKEKTPDAKPASETFADILNRVRTTQLQLPPTVDPAAPTPLSPSLTEPPTAIPSTPPPPTLGRPGPIPNMIGGHLGGTVLRDFLVRRTTTAPVTKLITTTTVIIVEGQPVVVPVVVPVTVGVDTTTTSPGTFRIPAPGRAYRISENESPLPQDRVYFHFNYFDGIEGDINRRLSSGAAQRLDSARETIGFEKTYLNGLASIGVRLPVNILTTGNGESVGLGSTSSSSIGDLTLITKVILGETAGGSAISGGVAVTAPTGTNNYAGVLDSSVNTFHSTCFQPYVGYLWRITERFYLQGFSAVDIPTAPQDITYLYNDIGIGYYFSRPRNSLVTAVAPTVEMRVTTPVNHRNVYSAPVPFSSPDIVELTFGGTMEIARRFTAAGALIVPVTGPKPYDFQVVAQLNWRF